MAVKDAKSQTGKPPRYMQLAGELREAIVAGKFAEGSQFPTENALCKRYEVSRFTVREALRRLQAEGLIARKRGSGTTVQRAAARSGTLHQPLSNVGEILQYARGSKVTYVPTGRGSLPGHLAEQIYGDVTGEWRCFRGVRRHADHSLPIAVTDAYFHEMLGDAVGMLDLSGGTLFNQIERLSGVAIGRVTQCTQAIAATKEVAALLEVDTASPVLRIMRVYTNPAGQIFEISASHHPGGRFAYMMHIDVDS